MVIRKLHCRLGKASGGCGPVFRWVWASLIIAVGGGMLDMMTFVFVS
jgi:hypothetical protein